MIHPVDVERIASGQGLWSPEQIKEAIRFVLDAIFHQSKMIADLEDGELKKERVGRMALARPNTEDASINLETEIRQEIRILNKYQAMLNSLEMNLDLKQYLVWYEKSNGYISSSGNEYVMASSEQQAIFRVEGGKMAKLVGDKWESLQLMKDFLR